MARICSNQRLSRGELLAPLMTLLVIAACRTFRLEHSETPFRKPGPPERMRSALFTPPVFSQGLSDAQDLKWAAALNEYLQSSRERIRQAWANGGVTLEFHDTALDIELALRTPEHQGSPGSFRFPEYRFRKHKVRAAIPGSAAYLIVPFVRPRQVTRAIPVGSNQYCPNQTEKWWAIVFLVFDRDGDLVASSSEFYRSSKSRTQRRELLTLVALNLFATHGQRCGMIPLPKPNFGQAFESAFRPMLEVWP